MKQSLIILTSILFFICNTSYCQKSSSSIERYAPKFDYIPEERATAASAGVTIALLNTTFVEKNLNQAGSPWDDFLRNLNSDLEELLTAKGFKIRGPFTSKDEMVYNDKTSSDFILQVKINLEVNVQRTYKEKYNFLSQTTSYTVTNGNGTMTCSIDLNVISCFNGEKLWKKNLSLPVENFEYKGTIKWDGYPKFFTEMKGDNGLWNPVCQKLEDEYQAMIKILWNQFDVQEMKGLAAESKKADKKE